MLELNVATRKILGKKSKKLRKEGLVPGIIYGYQMESLPVSVSYLDFDKVFRDAGESTLVKLNIQQEGREGRSEEASVLIHEPSFDPLSGKYIHVDFYKVRLDQKIKIGLPLEYVGESPAVKNAEGTLVKNFHEVEVEGYPHKLPKEIIVDVSRLQAFDDVILIKDLVVPEDIEVLEDLEAVVALVQPPRSEAELEALEGAPEESVEEVEVIGKEKKEEEEEGEVAEEEKGKEGGKE